jgi:hypothetical protein
VVAPGGQGEGFGVSFCPRCGSARREGAEFCGTCGLEFSEWEGSGGTGWPAPVATVPAPGPVPEVATAAPPAPPPRRGWGLAQWLLVVGGAGAAAAIVAFALLAGGDPEPRAENVPAAPLIPSPVVPSPPETVEEPEEPLAEDGSYQGQTDQGSPITFLVRGGGRTVGKLRFTVTMTGCSTPDFPTEYQARFNLRASIGPDGSFNGSVPGSLDLFRGRFVTPRQAEGVLRTEIEAPELQNCTSGRVDWTARRGG